MKNIILINTKKVSDFEKKLLSEKNNEIDYTRSQIVLIDNKQIHIEQDFIYGSQWTDGKGVKELSELLINLLGLNLNWVTFSRLIVKRLNGNENHYLTREEILKWVLL